MKNINVAIDGPAGAGKSTVARRAASILGYIYVDTGALYRAAALFITERDIPGSDVENALNEADISLRFIDGVQRVFLGERDVSELIRTPEISMAASKYSAMPPVREKLFGLQKQIAAENNVIMDGRDIGTVVLPDAQVKVFLTASPEERARRRYKELSEKPECPAYEEILADIIQRDDQDMNRETAPLKMAEDAVLLDSSELDLDETVEELVRIIKAGTDRSAE